MITPNYLVLYKYNIHAILNISNLKLNKLAHKLKIKMEKEMKEFAKMLE